MMRALFLVAVLSAAGCWSKAVGVRGIALLTGSECSPSTVAAGAAAQRATVTLRCPDEPEPLAEHQTDAGGRFFIPLEGREPGPSCTLTVAKEGYASRSYPIAELCAHALKADDACRAASVVAELVPLPSKETPSHEAASKEPAP